MSRWNPWMGSRRGHLTDWITQQWVRAGGRRLRTEDVPWLQGPSAQTRGISEQDFIRFAEATGLEPLPADENTGLLADLEALRSERFDPAALQAPVADFYLRTTRYRMSLWSRWTPAFAPFGRAVDALFARRLRQLQLPLAPLDGTADVDSRLLRFGTTHVAWLRTLRQGGAVLYAGLYSVAHPPNASGPCVKVVFPLPNGSATVLLEPIAGPDGSLVLLSAGETFGGPGFYFVVDAHDGTIWAKHVTQFHERIHVYVADDGVLHTDHRFWLWRRRFLRLHYLLE